MPTALDYERPGLPSSANPPTRAPSDYFEYTCRTAEYLVSATANLSKQQPRNDSVINALAPHVRIFLTVRLLGPRSRL